MNKEQIVADFDELEARIDRQQGRIQQLQRELVAMTTERDKWQQLAERLLESSSK